MASDRISTITTPAVPAPPSGSATVDRFLDAVARGGGVPASLYAPDAVLDATVPGWRFTVRGGQAVARKLGEWYGDPSTFEELERLAVEGGELVTYLLSSADRGVPYAVHHCHVLRFDRTGRISRDRVFCGGRWDAARLAEMAAADDAG